MFTLTTSPGDDFLSYNDVLIEKGIPRVLAMRRSLSSWAKSIFPTAPTRPIRKPRSLTLEQLETRDCPTVLPPGGPEPPPPGPGFPPVANPDHFAFAPDAPIRISIADLLANDTAAPGEPLTVELLDSPAGGQLDRIDVGLWEYTPGTGFTGSDAFSYRLFDGTDYSLPALVTFEQHPTPPSTPATPAVIDVTEAWLDGFEDEALGSVTVALFETAEADVLDWTASIDWGDGTTTTGQIVSDGDGRFRVVGEHTYDEWGLYLVQVTLTDTAEATHELFNLASIQFRNTTYTFTDPIGNSTQFVFAEGWRLTQEIDPLGHSSFYSYTTDGLLTSRTDRLGRAITFDYGTDGVLLGQTWLAADGLTVADTLSFSYTSEGLLLSASNGVGAYTFSWADGVLTGVTNPFGVTLTFGYDSDGRRTSVADSFGGLITSTYTDGLLSSRTLVAGALNLRVDLGYDAEGVPTQISRFAGPLQELVSQTEYAFAQGLLASITHRGAGGVILDQFLYQFDEDGFLSQITSDFVGETDYAYDSDGQLTGESSLLVSSTFSYDDNGNRVGGGYVVGPGNRLLADGTWSYSYDAEGNLVGKTHLVTGDSWTYSYDHRNQMTLAEKRDATGAVVLYAVYKYDVFGNRIEKAVDPDGDGPNAAVVTRYVLDGWNNMKPTPIGNEHFDVYAELDGTNQLIARYLHGDEFDQTFALVRVDGSTPEVHWLLTDHLNSVRLVLDEGGAVLDQIAYDAFGNIVAQLNPLLVNPILFASREFDFETGLYYNRARYLDPTTGRWTTQDPMGFAPGDPNLYRYVFNSSTMLVDPSGYWSWSGAWGGGLTGGGVGAGTGAFIGAPLFGIGALPGALIGGGVGFVGGFIAGGIWGGDVGQATGTNDFVGGLILGAPVGLVAGITGPLAYSLYTGAFWTSPAYIYTVLSLPTWPAAQQNVQQHLTRLANAGGSTTTVYTRLSGPIDPSRALSVSVGNPQFSQALPNAQATQWFSGNIPTALIRELERLGLAIRSITNMNGVTAEEIRFLPGAMQYIQQFFHAIPAP
jgi:RHS repeat-associated protein